MDVDDMWDDEEDRAAYVRKPALPADPVTTMDDEKAVEVMARAIAANLRFSWDQLSSPMQETYLARARNYIAAIRAQGGEVVWWRPIAEIESVPADTAKVARVVDLVTPAGFYFAILRGPEVKP